MKNTTFDQNNIPAEKFELVNANARLTDQKVIGTPIAYLTAA